MVVGIGPADLTAHLRNGLAMGANRAIHVQTADTVSPLTAARTFLKLVEKEQPGLVILGKQAIDDDANQTGQMLAALWDRPQATFASKVEIANGKATVTREVDAGLETIEAELPVVITTDLRLNEPRFIKLPDIMKAKSKPIDIVELGGLGVDVADHIKTTHYAAPPKRSKGVMVKDAAELVAALKQKGLLQAADRRIDMTKILVIAEHLDGKLNGSTARAVSAAQAAKPEAIDVIVLSDAPDLIAAEAAKIDGVSKVLTVTRTENAHALAAVYAPQIAKAASGYSHVFAPSSTFGKDVAPRVAALLGVSQVSDVMSVEGSHSFKRPIYAGNAIVTVEADSSSQVVATIRTASWPAAASNGNALIEALSLDVAIPSHTRFIELRQDKSDRPDLQGASKVVSGGRGVGSKENFEIIYKFARQDRCGRRRLAGRGRCRLCAERDASWPDGQDHRAGTLHRHRYLWRDPASHRYQGCRHDRGHQQGWRGTDFRDRRHRSGGGFVQDLARAGNGAGLNPPQKASDRRPGFARSRGVPLSDAFAPSVITV